MRLAVSQGGPHSISHFCGGLFNEKHAMFYFKLKAYSGKFNFGKKNVIISFPFCKLQLMKCARVEQTGDGLVRHGDCQRVLAYADMTPRCPERDEMASKQKLRPL